MSRFTPERQVPAWQIVLIVVIVVFLAVIKAVIKVMERNSGPEIPCDDADGVPIDTHEEI